MGNEDELKELVRLLKKQVYRNNRPYGRNRTYNNRSQNSRYTPRTRYGNSGFRGGYPRQKQSFQNNYHQQPEQAQTRTTKQVWPSPTGRIWTEPTQYRAEKERLIYDPEVKDLLRRIEEKLTQREPDSEEMLKELEEHPEQAEKMSEKLMRKMNEESEKFEAETIGQSNQDPGQENSNRIEENSTKDATEEPSNAKQEDVKPEQSEQEKDRYDDDERGTWEPPEEHFEDAYDEDQADVLREMEANDIEEQELPNDTPKMQEPIKPVENSDQVAPVIDIVEPEVANAETPHILEPKIDAAPQIEAQDLTQLEAELFIEPVDQTEAEEQVETEET